MSLRSRVRYRFDNLLARGTWAVLLWLGAITLLVVLVSSLLLTLFGVTFAGTGSGSWLEDFWQSLLRVIDTGTMAGDVGWGRRVLALLVTVVGILIAGTLIGLIAAGVEQRVDDMQRGRSTVIESRHVVILGASSGLPLVVEQVAAAGRAAGLESIVVLAPSDSVASTHELRAAIADPHQTRLVVRRGESTRVADLDMVAIGDARAVIVLADDGTSSDAHVVNTVLAVGIALDGFGRIPVAAELRDTATAQRLVDACGDGVYPLVASQSAGRVAAFALREPGLNQVIRELLDLGGADLHVLEPGHLAGMTFAAAVLTAENARPIGRLRADGSIEIKPSPATRFDPGDRVIAIAHDVREVAVHADDDPRAGTSLPGTRDPRLFAEPQVEHLIFVGWNELGVHLLDRLASASAEGSTAEIVHDPDRVDPRALPPERVGSMTIRRTSDLTEAWGQLHTHDESRFTSIVLLASHDGDAESADSQTLLELNVLRRELAGGPGPGPRVVVELRDPRSVDLAPVVSADDYVISPEIGSRLIAQLAMQPEKRAILLGLDGSGDASFHLVDATALGISGAVRFGDVVAAAYDADCLAVGWRRAGSHEMILNPRTSARIELGAGDEIVVVG